MVYEPTGEDLVLCEGCTKLIERSADSTYQHLVPLLKLERIYNRHYALVGTLQKAVPSLTFGEMQALVSIFLGTCKKCRNGPAGECQSCGG